MAGTIARPTMAMPPKAGRCNSRPPISPAGPPKRRAGSPGYAPSYQQPQPNPNRQPANRSTVDPRYRQPNSAQDGPNNDSRRTVRPTNQMGDAPRYPNPQASSTNGPNYGYPPAHARTVAYNRQDIEYADDQPSMPTGGPGQSVMSGPMPPQGYMQASAPPALGTGRKKAAVPTAIALVAARMEAARAAAGAMAIVALAATLAKCSANGSARMRSAI